MKKIYNNIFYSLAIVMTLVLFSCEQTTYEPNMTVAPGGGTVTTYKAYTLDAKTVDDVYGRIVFYKYSSTVTLVQIGLYHTSPSTSYTASIFSGSLAGGGTTVLKALDDVSGSTGAFATNKYFTITGAGFYDGLSNYDANVKVLVSNSSVSEGNIGKNASPVAEN